MRIKQNKRVIEEAEMDMTPMIDIVFQLLLFFLLSAKFIALEGQLSSDLPKDRGLQASFAKIEPDEVIFFLGWQATTEADGYSRVQCQTINYRPSAGAASGQDYTFQEVDAPGIENAQGFVPYAGGRAKYGENKDWPSYWVPNFVEIETYLQARANMYKSKDSGKGIPVTINVEDDVPMQMVTNIVDICTRLRISNVTIAAKEIPID